LMSDLHHVCMCFNLGGILTCVTGRQTQSLLVTSVESSMRQLYIQICPTFEIHLSNFQININSAGALTAMPQVAHTDGSYPVSRRRVLYGMDSNQRVTRAEHF
jgi:hypothetical protein